MSSLTISNDRFRYQKFKNLPCCCTVSICANVNLSLKFTPYAFLVGEVTYRPEYRIPLGLPKDPVKKDERLVVKLHHFYEKNAMDFYLLKLMGRPIKSINFLLIPTYTAGYFLTIPAVSEAYQKLIDVDFLEKRKKNKDWLIHTLVPLKQHPDIQNLVESLATIYLSNGETLNVSAVTESKRDKETQTETQEVSGDLEDKRDEETQTETHESSFVLEDKRDEETEQDDIPGSIEERTIISSKLSLVGIDNPTNYCFFTAALLVMLRLEVFFKHANVSN